MDYLPWRRMIALAVVVLAGLLSVAASEPASAQTVRKSITAYTPAELMSLRRGVATMMSRNSAPRGSADFRRSWIYWANMHSHFGSGCGGAISGNGMTGVTLWTASNPNETATWCKCEHHTPQFLTWHRMLLFYFERVLRQASGDPNLTLPYWDYATDRQIPPAFRDTTYVNENGATVPNPLRVEARRVQLNNGSAGLGDGVVQTSNAMSCHHLRAVSHPDRDDAAWRRPLHAHPGRLRQRPDGQAGGRRPRPDLLSAPCGHRSALRLLAQGQRERTAADGIDDPEPDLLVRRCRWQRRHAAGPRHAADEPARELQLHRRRRLPGRIAARHGGGGPDRARAGSHRRDDRRRSAGRHECRGGRRAVRTGGAPRDRPDQRGEGGADPGRPLQRLPREPER